VLTSTTHASFSRLFRNNGAVAAASAPVEITADTASAITLAWTHRMVTGSETNQIMHATVELLRAP
jgi:hypothetical protein